MNSIIWALPIFSSQKNGVREDHLFDRYSKSWFLNFMHSVLGVLMEAICAHMLPLTILCLFIYRGTMWYIWQRIYMLEYTCLVFDRFFRQKQISLSPFKKFLPSWKWLHFIVRFSGSRSCNNLQKISSFASSLSKIRTKLMKKKLRL